MFLGRLQGDVDSEQTEGVDWPAVLQSSQDAEGRAGTAGVIGGLTFGSGIGLRLKYRGIFWAASFLATGLSLGTIPCSPYSSSQSLSIEHPRYAAHFAAVKNDGHLFPESTRESMGTPIWMARAIVPSERYTRPSGPMKRSGGKGVTRATRAGTDTRAVAFPAPLATAPALFGLSFFLLLSLATVIGYTAPAIPSMHISAARLEVILDTPEPKVYTERQREEALRQVAILHVALDRIATSIVKAELPRLGEGIASLERAAFDFGKRIRVLY